MYLDLTIFLKVFGFDFLKLLSEYKTHLSDSNSNITA